MTMAPVPLQLCKCCNSCLIHGASLACIMFCCSVCLTGYPPFYSDDPLTTCRKIVNWRMFLKFPEEIRISSAAKDLIQRLMCDVDDRLGTIGVQVKQLNTLPWVDSSVCCLLWYMKCLTPCPAMGWEFECHSKSGVVLSAPDSAAAPFIRCTSKP